MFEPTSAEEHLSCSPPSRGSGKKLRSDHYLNYQHQSNTLTIPSGLYYTISHHLCPDWYGATHIPLSDVSRPAAQSGILGSICFPPRSYTVLSTPVAPPQLPSSAYFSPLSTCCNFWWNLSKNFRFVGFVPLSLYRWGEIWQNRPLSNLYTGALRCAKCCCW